MATAFGGQSQQRWGDNTANVNEYLRDIFATDLSGRATGTADARRKGMLLLAFFKTTCGTCQLTFPYLQKLADAYKESGKFSVLGVSQDDEEKTRAFLDQYGIKFTVLLDRDLYHSMVYGLTNVPTLFFADGSGLVLRKVIGWDRAAINDISERVAKFAEVEPVKIVADDDPVPAYKPG
jgi:peroxiredoxin